MKLLLRCCVLSGGRQAYPMPVRLCSHFCGAVERPQVNSEKVKIMVEINPKKLKNRYFWQKNAIFLSFFAKSAKNHDCPVLV